MSSSTVPAPGTVIELQGAANCRDLGGWPIVGGTSVRRGLVFRSTDLAALTDTGVAELTALGVGAVFDLRTAAERAAQPDRVPTGVSNVSLDVLADDPTSAAAGAADLPRLLSDPAAIESFLKGRSITSLFEATYRDIVTLPSALAAYRSMYTSIADTTAPPSLFHCTTGKDRTGWGAAALLSFLGVSLDDVKIEYLLTNSEILPFTQPLYDQFAAAGGDPKLLRPALGVEASYLDTAFDTMTSTFGSIEVYFADGLKLDDTVLDGLRSRLIA